MDIPTDTQTRALLGLERTMNLIQGRGGEGGEGLREGGMTVSVIHILIGMFNSNPMIPQYLNSNLT